MKKFVFAFGLIGALLVAFLVTGSVYAQGGTPPTPATPGDGYGYGRGGMMGGRMMSGSVGGGILHDAMIAVYAEELGISVEDLNSRLAGGETMAQIATTEGLTADEFRALMLDARGKAIDQAVADGTLTQEQADWMKQRGGGMMGSAARGRGMMRGGNAGASGCPYYSQTN